MEDWDYYRYVWDNDMDVGCLMNTLIALLIIIVSIACFIS